MTIPPVAVPRALPSDARVERARAVAEIVSGGSLVVLALDDPGCNPVELQGGAVVLWEELGDEPREVGSIVDTICAATAATAATAAMAPTAAADIDLSIRTLLADLVSLQLVTVVPPR